MIPETGKKYYVMADDREALVGVCVVPHIPPYNSSIMNCGRRGVRNVAHSVILCEVAPNPTLLQRLRKLFRQ